MPNRQRKWLFVAIAIAVIILLTLIAAPNSSGRKNDSGSTYGGNPGGYGAWYEYMSQRQTPIERWRKPFSQFAERNLEEVTYIQVNSKSNFLLNMDLTQAQKNWVRLGNTLVIIGKYEPTSAAPFEKSIRDRESAFDQRQIKIKTTRRYQKQPQDNTKTILSDRYGAVVWQEEIGRGKVIYCVTPYLAANAYQDSDNYQFLAELVSQNKKIWVDEYIHGYKDREIAREQQDVLSYLIKTPWFLLFIQTVLIAVVSAVTAFRRFGKPVTPKKEIADNSTMYINALAGVLELANSSDFVVDAIARDERRKLQVSLGLGNSLVDDKTLIAVYQQKSESSAKLIRLLQIDSKQKISNAQLISFIEDWQQINRDRS